MTSCIGAGRPSCGTATSTGLDVVAADLVTDDFVGNWPLRPGLVHGPRELAGLVRDGRPLFDELRFSTEVGPLVDGDLVAARWVARGAYGGRPVEFRGHDILRVSQDRFAGYWVVSEAEPTHEDE